MRGLLSVLCIPAALTLASAAWALPAADAPTSKKAAAERPRSPEPSVAATDVAAQPSRDFICPNAEDDTALACFLNATAHLYAVCSRVKSIEVKEFGYEDAEIGRNGYKSNFCRQKQLASLPSIFNAALQEAEKKYSCEVVVELAELYSAWEMYLMAIRPYPNESEEAYHERVKIPAHTFAAYQESIRAAMAESDALPQGKKKPACVVKAAALKKKESRRRGRGNENLPDK